MTDTVGRTVRALPPRPDLDHLRKQAKRRLRLMRQADPAAALAVAQRAVARDYGFRSWRALKTHVDAVLRTGLSNPWIEQVAMRIAAAWRSGGAVAAERVVREARDHHPESDDLLAWHADLMVAAHQDLPAASALSERLMERPTGAGVVHHARFRWHHGGADDEELEALYQRAFALAETDPPAMAMALNNHAAFLRYRRKDPEGAERQLRRAAALDHHHPRIAAVHAGICARHLWELGKTAEAEEYFRRAFALSRRDTIDMLPFAALLASTGRAEEGLALIPELLAGLRHSAVGDRSGIELCCRFLVYAHGTAPRRGPALRRLKQRLRPDGHESLGLTDLSRNADAAATDHPQPELLRALAGVLAKPRPPAESIAGLDRFPAWRALPA